MTRRRLDARLRQGRPGHHGDRVRAPPPAGADGVPRARRVLGRPDRAPDDPLLDAVTPHAPTADAATDRRADGKDPGPGRRRGRRLRPEERRVQREDVAVVVASIDLGRPVKWIEDRLEHLAIGRSGPRGDGGPPGRRHRRMAPPRCPDGHQAQHRRLSLRPLPRCHVRLRSAASFQGPTADRGDLSATTPAVFSNKATYVSYRGPWATADFLRERLLDIVARELGFDPLEVRRRNYVERDEPPLAMLTGQPFIGGDDTRAGRAGGAAGRLGRVPKAPGRAARPRALPRHRDGLLP